jgi:pimeloyl-[acyl-carrier protein] methyl ester esterase
MELVLLPGMDGTARLFQPLRSALPSTLEVLPVAYPTDTPMGYAALLETLPVPSEPFAVVAESFSGPLALMLAARKPPGMKALVLVSTFVSSPVPAWQKVAASFLGERLFRGPPPKWAVRRYLLGGGASQKDVEAVRAATASVRADVLAKRAREIFRVDASAELASCPVPVTYLRGTRDSIVGRSMMERMKAILPAMTCVELAGPHLLLQCKPAESTREVLRAIGARP